MPTGLLIGEHLTAHDSVLKSLAMIYTQEPAFKAMKNDESTESCDVTSMINLDLSLPAAFDRFSYARASFEQVLKIAH